MSHVEIAITEENLWFTERYLNLFDYLDLFPADAVGTESQRGVRLVFHTDLGFDITSDIDGGKLQLRNRSKLHGWLRFTTEHGLRPGDMIVLERIGPREYKLELVRAGSNARE